MNGIRTSLLMSAGLMFALAGCVHQQAAKSPALSQLPPPPEPVRTAQSPSAPWTQPAPGTTQSTSYAMPAAMTGPVFAKADLELLRSEFAGKLKPRKEARVRQGKGVIELQLLSIDESDSVAHDAFKDFKQTVRRFAESRGAMVSGWHEGRASFHFKYARGNVQGTVEGQLDARVFDEFSRPNWDIILKVRESR